MLFLNDSKAAVHLELTSAGGEEHNGSKSYGVSAAKFGFIFIFQTEKNCLFW